MASACLGEPVTGAERGIFEVLKTENSNTNEPSYYLVMYTINDETDKRVFKLEKVLTMIPVEHFRTMLVDYFERHVTMDMRRQAEVRLHRQRGWPTPVEPVDLNKIMEMITHIMNSYRG